MPPKTVLSFSKRLFSYRSSAYVQRNLFHTNKICKTSHRPWINSSDDWNFASGSSWTEETLAAAAPSGSRSPCHRFWRSGLVQQISLRSLSPFHSSYPHSLVLDQQLDDFVQMYMNGLAEEPSLEQLARRTYMNIGYTCQSSLIPHFRIDFRTLENLHPAAKLQRATIHLRPYGDHLRIPGQKNSEITWAFHSDWEVRARTQLRVESKHMLGQDMLDKMNQAESQQWDSSHPMYRLAGTIDVPPITADPVFELHSMLKRTFDVMGRETVSNPPLIALALAAYQLADSRQDYPPLQDLVIQFRPLEDKGPPDEYIRILSQFASQKMSRADYERIKSSSERSGLPHSPRIAYLSLGSNMGNPVANIEQACKELAGNGITVTRTSSLYRSKPMYLEDQDHFVNCVCEVETNHEPLELLKRAKDIENNLGRVKTIDNGPRPIDLDIILYNNTIFNDETLTIPHKKMMEREFVLRPLCDIIPKSSAPTQSPLIPFKDSLQGLEQSEGDSCVLFTPLSASRPSGPVLLPRSSDRRTVLMAIVNMTPDSFSDGGLHDQHNADSTIASIHQALGQSDQVSIIDVGGQSTRPNAVEVPVEEEISRVVPVIERMRADAAFDKVAISVDTYRSQVAVAAIAAGADIVNDVSAGQLDPQMLPKIAELGCPCILMHMRGTPKTMSKLTDYKDGVIQGVGSELYIRVKEAEKAGIKRWRILLDPGIGFAKDQAQNLELLRRFEELRNFEGLEGLPWVVGASRKRFIGKVTGVEDASARQWGTASCVTAAIQGGADIVRVHDVDEMSQVVKMADAIFRA